MEINKIYCKTDTNNKITKFFICLSEKPKYHAILKGSFNPNKDFDDAIELDGELLNKIHLGISQIIDGEFIENYEEYTKTIIKPTIENDYVETENQGD